jgi:hypothetical protein
MSDFDLQSRFPEMTPVRKAPSLFLFNGCGTTVYGRRGFDPETYTYVKTLCFCLLFVPVLALRAYRVVDLERGWAFLGRVPISGLARLWNALMPVAILSAVGGLVWIIHVRSPEYAIQRQLEEADRLAAEGQVEKAALGYREVARSSSPKASTAARKLRGLFDGSVQSATPQQAAGAFRVAVEMRQQLGLPADFFERGHKLAEKYAKTDPAGALALLNAVAPMAPDAKAGLPLRRQVLEQLVKAEPRSPEYLSQLAEVYEAQGERARCEALLTPIKGELGQREGARILGQLYAHQGKLDEAHALLGPYAEARLDKLHAAEKAFEEARKGVEDRTLAQLRNGKAADFPWQEYRTLDKDQQDVLVMNYLHKAVRNDDRVQAARDAVLKETRVVEVALDLGIVLLQRGQAKADPVARRAELEKAEKIFLAVRGVAGQTDEFRLGLGQVYYWLGRHQEGRKLFDALLADKGRSAQALIGVSQQLRAVGSTAEARALAEEAFGKAQDADMKSRAASQRALLFTDLDDEITWRSRVELNDPGLKADLESARGRKALQDGRREEAARHLRAALDGYARLPESAASLNNSALTYFALYRATGDRDAINQGVAQQEKALALLPGDSILLGNSAVSVLEVALWDVLSPTIDLRALKRQAASELLPYLYQDQAGRDRLVERLRKNPGLAKAIAYLERLLVLAPRREHNYELLTALYALKRDAGALRGLAERLQRVDLDLTDYTRQTVALYKGTDDAKLLQQGKAGLAQTEESLRVARKVGGATLAVAADTLARQRTGLAMLGQAADAEEIVRLAEEAHAAAPSRATQGSLIAALLWRAGQALEKQHPEYAALAAKGRRSLGPTYLIALTMAGPVAHEKLRQAVLANGDVKRALELVKESVAQFPDEPSGWHWAMLSAASPREADQVAQALRTDEMNQALRRVDGKIAPLNGAEALNAYWSRRAAGNEAEALAELRQAAARGVPLPID